MDFTDMDFTDMDFTDWAITLPVFRRLELLPSADEFLIFLFANEARRA